MKRFICILLLGMFLACSEEDALTPTEVKDWYVITPTENMDEVDEAIYHLYEKYNKAVFYKDTIGSEDRGWKDENGNPKLYYEVLRLSYDMTESNNIQTKITYTPADVSTPESKKAMLPLLELMDEKLFAWIEGADVHVPAVLIVQDMERAKKPLYVYRGFGVLGFALNCFEQKNADSLIQRTFLHEVCYVALQENLSTYQDIVINAFENNTSASPAVAKECWGVNYETFVPSYVSWLTSVNNLQVYANMKLQYEQQKEEALEQLKNENLTEAERKKWETKLSSAEMMLTFVEGKLGNYDEYKANLELYCPENFGLLGLTQGKVGDKLAYFVPTAVEDFAAYLDAMLDYSEEEFKAKYEKYPLVQARYILVQHVLKNAGFDIQRIRSEID
ncbi:MULTISPECIES: hypothetical protein [Butyricimonas]|uniref:hypothetical protein n=1 Tax=Butyricimonas TaxID=574697 RepID=UPI000C0849B6|nr:MULTISPECIES: hypothetical protein [Butyricimonas]MCB6972223.1 hypothetical protein [Butyricimonas synergistica]MCG4519214.1 hypothetical protein [Butyricimonas sp. DFI.6.44]